MGDVARPEWRRLVRRAAAGTVLMATCAAPALAWEPTKPVEFIVPAGTGGGADQMARVVQGIISKNKLMKEQILVVNKPGGAGAEGLMAAKQAAGDPHKIIITLSNLFTTPLSSGMKFNWRDLTPVSMLALDQFVLWTNAEASYKTAREYVEAVKTAGPSKMRMGGTGIKQEDQILTVAIEKATGTKFIYVPFKGGGDVAVQLVNKHVDSTVNNPIEAVSQWRSSSVRALCVFDEQRMPYKARVTATQAWADIPTCKEAGLPVSYQMLRGIFMPSGVNEEQVAFYVDLFKKVRNTNEWKEYMERGAFNQTFLTGQEYRKWLEGAETLHRNLMKEAGFLPK